MQAISSPMTEEVSVPPIEFLNINGSLSHDTVLIGTNNQFISERDHQTFGKVEYYDSKVRYFVKTFKGGRPGEIVADPYSHFFKVEDMSVVPTTRGRRTCEYLEVSPYNFGLYQRYLISRNPVDLRFVERAILNGEGMKNGQN